MRLAGAEPPSTDAFGGVSGYTGSLGTSVSGTSCIGASPCDSFLQPFTFTGPATLDIQDLFNDGDKFQVFVDGVSVGMTSSPTNDGTLCGNDPLSCVGNSKFSSGAFVISGAGNHTISISVIQESTVGTETDEAALELIGSGGGGGGGGGGGVPEPTTFSLMALGLGGLLLGWRARRKVQS